jgi:hypothetical protein
MKKILLSLFVIVLITQTTCAQSLHKKKQRKAKTCCKSALADTCQSIQSYTISQPSIEVSKNAEFSLASLFICPIADDIYGRILGRALKEFRIPY